MILFALPPDDRPSLPRPVEDPLHAWVLVIGDPVHGFSFCGPFRTREEAEVAQADDANQLRRCSWVAKLYGAGE